ncbi:MAG: quinone-dependent dihydroorotate dehydrogenase [Armatimonadota bacterium]
MNLYRLLFPLIRRLDPESAHHLVLRLLGAAQRSSPGRALLRRMAGPTPEDPVALFGLRFPNRVGVAAGFDKDVHMAEGLGLLGFGHVEVGTLTPRPQPGNPRPRIFRLADDRAIINRMGFPNCGVEAALPRLRALDRERRRFVLGVSLGKQKETPLERAADDYLAVMRSVYPYADYLAVNISSPNTPDLRALQGDVYLRDLLSQLQTESEVLARASAAAARPLLVKIAPDLTWDELDRILAIALETGVAGLIATNTTLSREGLTDPRKTETGGMSGQPLLARSTEIVAHIHRQTGGRLPVIGVGGIFSADDARKKLDAGASLVQVYTGLVYEGPGIAGTILRGLCRR